MTPKIDYSSIEQVKDPMIKYTFEEAEKLLAECEIDTEKKLVKFPAYFDDYQMYAAIKMYSFKQK